MTARLERVALGEGADAGDACALVLVIDRPGAKNAIDRAVAQAIGDAAARADTDASVRALVITGAGDVFVAGGDLKEIREAAEGGAGPGAVLDLFENHVSALERCRVPVIAAVQGDAMGGGCELLLLCDVVVCEEHAGLSFRHARMSLAPAWGGLVRLVERVGPTHASRLLFTAMRLPAREALAIGLVTELAPRGGSRGRALELAREIAAARPEAIAALKKLVHETCEARRAGWRERERAAFEGAWMGPGHRAALAAFFGRKG